MYELTICHLYPDLLNLYGDRGNIIALTKRCEWRGIRVRKGRCPSMTRWTLKTLISCSLEVVRTTSSPSSRMIC